jgi:hypothetical protein
MKQLINISSSVFDCYDSISIETYRELSSALSFESFFSEPPLSLPVPPFCFRRPSWACHAYRYFACHHYFHLLRNRSDPAL